jgi:hypothetical protein
MSNIQHSETINVPAAQVVAYISDIRNAPSYISDIIGIKSIQTPPGASEGAPVIGTSATFDFRFMGGVTDLTLRLDNYQSGPPTVITLVNDENNAVVQLTVTPLNASSCRLDASITAPLAGFVLNMMFGSSIQHGLAQVKRLMEQPQG